MNKYLIGLITAILTFLLLFYSLENDKSFYQIAFGFLFFIFPVMFISSFRSNEAAFILVLSSLLFWYFAIYSWEYNDTLIGALHAIIFGVPISYFRVESYELHDSEDYKTRVKRKVEENARKRNWIFF